MLNSPPRNAIRRDGHGVTSRIREWVALGVPGIVWIRYVSDTSRDMVLDAVYGCPIERIHSIHPIRHGAEWLEEQLKAVPDCLWSPYFSRPCSVRA